MLKKLNSPIFPYDKIKVNILKSILPFGIILQHLCKYDYPEIQWFAGVDEVIMWLFMAMSGYGLVFSYINNTAYIDKFLQKSLTKLFVPYFIALCSFIIYRAVEGIDQIALFQEKGLYSFVPTSWFLWTLCYFYLFFFIIFNYLKWGVIAKTFLLCMAVIVYCIIAPHIGIEFWRYNRCPGFCIGALLALIYSKYKEYMRIRFMLLLVPITYLMMRFSIHFNLPVPIPLFKILLIFIIMWLVKIPNFLKDSKIVKFVSSISFELFILQFIPIYIVVNDLQLSSTFLAVATVFLMDIIISYFAHKVAGQVHILIEKNIYKK